MNMIEPTWTLIETNYNNGRIVDSPSLESSSFSSSFKKSNLFVLFGWRSADPGESDSAVADLLGQLVHCRIVVFNGRRVNEPARLTIENANDMLNIKWMSSNYAQNLTTEEKKLAKSLHHICSCKRFIKNSASNCSKRDERGNFSSVRPKGQKISRSVSRAKVRVFNDQTVNWTFICLVRTERHSKSMWRGRRGYLNDNDTIWAPCTQMHRQILKKTLSS